MWEIEYIKYYEDKIILSKYIWENNIHSIEIVSKKINLLTPCICGKMLPFL